MPESYGYAYLTSYGWTGSGTGLRKDAIDKPLVIPPKKSLGGLGKDRDDAFPFWDHLFTAASNAITIKVSTDDEDVDDTEDPSLQTDPGSMPLRRTTTGIISNRRPILGTPVSTSGSTTPNPNADADIPSRLSLLATAKREAARRGLYSRFFRGPVLSPVDDPRADTTLHSVFSPSESISTPPPEHAGQDRATGERKKRKSEDKAETREEGRACKRMKRERKAAKAAKRVEKALEREVAKQKKVRLDDIDRKARRHQVKETQSEETKTSPDPKSSRKQTRKCVADSTGQGDDLELAKRTRKKLEEGLARTNGGQQNISLGPSSNLDTTNTFDVVLTTRMKKRKRKDTPP